MWSSLFEINRSFFGACFGGGVVVSPSSPRMSSSKHYFLSSVGLFSSGFFSSSIWIDYESKG